MGVAQTERHRDGRGVDLAAGGDGREGESDDGGAGPRTATLAEEEHGIRVRRVGRMTPGR